MYRRLEWVWRANLVLCLTLSIVLAAPIYGAPELVSVEQAISLLALLLYVVLILSYAALYWLSLHLFSYSKVEGYVKRRWQEEQVVKYSIKIGVVHPNRLGGEDEWAYAETIGGDGRINPRYVLLAEALSPR